MGNILTGDQSAAAFRRLGEIQRQLGQNGGYPFDPERLLIALQAISDGRFEAVGGQFPSVVLAGDLIPDDWTIVEDIAPSKFDVSKLKLKSFLRSEDPGWINGSELRKRAPTLKGHWSLVDGKRMLDEQDKISVEFQGFYIPLTGTLLRAPGGRLCLACLCFDGERWYLGFNRLDDNWHGRGRLACSE